MYRTEAVGVDLESFVRSEVAIYVGTSDAGLNPEITRAWGASLLSDGSVSLCIDRAPGDKTLSNLIRNGAIAVTFSSAADYRSVQLKGVFLDSGEPTEDELKRVEGHRWLFADATAKLGVPTRITSELWSSDVVRIRFQPEASFNQTPGLGAGAPL